MSTGNPYGPKWQYDVIRGPGDNHTMMYGAPAAPAWPSPGDAPIPYMPISPPQWPAREPPFFDPQPTIPLRADLTMVPAHIIDGLVELLPHLRTALKAAKASGSHNGASAVAFLEGMALQQRRERNQRAEGQDDE